MTQSSGLRNRSNQSPKTTEKADKSSKQINSTTSKQTKKETKKETKAPTYSGNLLKRFLAYCFEEEDASYLAVFRILWGSIMTYEAYTYTIYDYAKMYSSFYNSVIQFKYYGFEWCVVPENPEMLKLLILVQLISGIFITIGFFYRTSSTVFFLAFGYMYCLEQAMYLNHFYLVCLLNIMMMILPCNCLLSIDSLLWRKRVYSPTCPKWCLIFVKAELAIVYTYAGVAKVNEDWLRGQPLRQWLHGKDKTPLIGPVFNRDSTAYFMSYGGLIYDLIVAELLLWGPTKWLGVALSVFFHVANKIVFNIGIFPWMMLASTPFYFRPDWPKVLLHYLRGGTMKTFQPIKSRTFSETAPTPISIWRKILLLLLLAFLLHQFLVPLRLHLYPGTVAWNEYGHQFSWRMKLRTKQCDSASFVYNPETHEAFEIPMDNLLNPRQYRKMSSRPDMIIQFAHFLRDWTDDAIHKINPNITSQTEVYVESWCELNGRPFQQFTDPTVNLAAEQKWIYPYKWVTEIAPLTEQEKADYPWNWEWNFNWLKPGKDVLPPRRYSKQAELARIMISNAYDRWNKWIKERDPLVQIRQIPRPFNGWYPRR